jgi:hypothetical protein
MAAAEDAPSVLNPGTGHAATGRIRSGQAKVSGASPRDLKISLPAVTPQKAKRKAKSEKRKAKAESESKKRKRKTKAKANS